MKKDWRGDAHSVYVTLGASNHGKQERVSHDYYATDPSAIDALVKCFPLPAVVCEPACGEGHLSRRMEQLGAKVYSSDIVDRGFGDVIDFFNVERLPAGCEAIITNPPYIHAERFVEHSLDLLPVGGMCAMFLRTAFLEGQRRWERIYSVTPPMCVCQFIKRQKCGINGVFGKAAAMAFSWFVWVKGWSGETTIKWI